MAEELPRGDRSRTDDEAAEPRPPEPPPPLSEPPGPEPGPPPSRPRLRPLGKMSKKQRKLRKDAYRPLDSWERYRALTDVLDEAIELVDLADHKARFALVIMAALNVLLFFVATRTDIVEELPGNTHVWLAGFLLVYVGVALYFFMQAIESLRPRKQLPQVPHGEEVGPDERPMGIRFYEDILSHDLDEYQRAWRDLRFSQLNNELAVQAHALASINHAKYAALRRLYMGLKIITLMAVGLVVLGALFAFVGTAKAGRHGRKNAQVLGTPSRMVTPGVQEPSGVVFHPRTGHLFVVGDEGSLVQYEPTTRAEIQRHPVRGNLEDLAVHTPTGFLMLVDEQRSELSLYDPSSRQVLKRWTLDRKAVLAQDPGGRNNGFEGLAFREEAGRPGGGVFYLVHQRDPSMLVALTVDTNGPGGTTIGGESVLSRWLLKEHGDLTAVTFLPTLGVFLVIADKEDRLLVLRHDGSLETEIPLPGQQQEGLTLDSAGSLWVADDQDKRLLWMDGVLSAVERYMRDPGSFTDPLAK